MITRDHRCDMPANGIGSSGGGRGLRFSSDATFRTVGDSSMRMYPVRRQGYARRGAPAALLAVLLLAASFAAPGAARAELPAPVWMPGSPILGGAQVILLWLPVPSAMKYRIYVNGKQAAESAAGQYMMASPAEPGEYRIQVAAVDAAGAEGAKSPPGVIRIIAIDPPGELYARVVEKKVQLRWDQAKGAVIYNVYRADKEGGESKLLSSVQGDGYTDPAVQQGKSYFYTVTSKDLGGKESAKSQTLRVDVPLPQAAGKEVRIEIKVVPTKSLSESLFLGSKKLESFGDMKIGPDGHVYVVDGGKKQVLKLDPKSLDIVSVFPTTREEKDKIRRMTSIGFSGDGRIFAADPFSQKVFVFDAAGKMVSEFPVPAPTDKEILENVLPHLRAHGHFPSGIYVDGKEKAIWIADPRFNTVYRFDLNGKFLGTLGHGGNPEDCLAGPAEILPDRNGTDLYVTEPLAHVVKVIGKKDGKVKRVIGKKSSGFIGGFIGMRGVDYDPDGNVVITDSGVHSIQVFDGKTGDYLYHFGDESGTVDPTMKERALLGIEMPTNAYVVGNTLYVFRGDRMNVATREIVKGK